MDIPRESQARKRRIRRGLYGLVGLGAVAAVTMALGRLRPAAPTVERSTVWVDVVKRGPMLRQVHGIGRLVPEEIQWIPAANQGRVERILVQPGAAIEADTVLVELSNPDLENATLSAEWELKAGEAAYSDLEVKLESGHLGQQSDAARVEADYRQARLQAEVDGELARQGLFPSLNLRLEQAKAEQLGRWLEIEKKRLEIDRKSREAQLAAQRARVEQLRAAHALRRSQLEQLKVRAGIRGVLQLVAVEVGLQVTPGTNLARVADPARLKAQLKIAETQAKDVQLGQAADVDTRNGIIPGRVVRIDPSVQESTRTVDVKLLAELPQGAVPDLTVDGTIEVERIAETVYVGRPVQGQAFGTVALFKLEPAGRMANRVQVKLGRSSVSTIEIVGGLQAGDRVILSDMTQHDDQARIELR
jgi:HlyD family secretion protein